MTKTAVLLWHKLVFATLQYFYCYTDLEVVDEPPQFQSVRASFPGCCHGSHTNSTIHPSHWKHLEDKKKVCIYITLKNS